MRIAKNKTFHSPKIKKISALTFEKEEYLPTSRLLFKTLKKELSTAEKEIRLVYFSAEISVAFCEILDVLIQKSKSGVRVRILLDGLGTFFKLPLSYRSAMEYFGIQLTFHRRFSLAKRNHLKLAIIDKNSAVIGGINLADKYINVIEKCGHWKESGMVIRDKNAVIETTRFYDSLWFNEKYNKSKKAALKERDSGFYYNTFGVINREVSELYYNLIDGAKNSIELVSPYFVPTERLLDKLIRAAERGVSVTLIVPLRPDKKTVYAATKHYAHVLASFNCKVYLYARGFVHQKTLTVDKKYTVNGSMNLDRRSMNDFLELCYLSKNRKIISSATKDFDNILKDCIRLPSCETCLERFIGNCMTIVKDLM